MYSIQSVSVYFFDISALSFMTSHFHYYDYRVSLLFNTTFDQLKAASILFYVLVFKLFCAPKKIPTPKTEVGKNQTNNQVLIP